MTVKKSWLAKTSILVSPLNGQSLILSGLRSLNIFIKALTMKFVSPVPLIVLHQSTLMFRNICRNCDPCLLKKVIVICSCEKIQIILIQDSEKEEHLLIALTMICSTAVLASIFNANDPVDEIEQVSTDTKLGFEQLQNSTLVNL